MYRREKEANGLSLEQIKLFWKLLPFESKKYWEKRGRGGDLKRLPAGSLRRLRKTMRSGSEETAAENENRLKWMNSPIKSRWLIKTLWILLIYRPIDSSKLSILLFSGLNSFFSQAALLKFKAWLTIARLIPIFRLVLMVFVYFLCLPLLVLSEEPLPVSALGLSEQHFICVHRSCRLLEIFIKYTVSGDISWLPFA